MTEAATTKCTIANELSRLADIVGGKAWGAEKGKPRIYMPTRRRDAKIFFTFEAVYPISDEDNDFASAANREVDGVVHGIFGSRLCVCLADCGQTAKWYAAQKRQLAESHRVDALLIDFALAGADADTLESIGELDPDDIDADTLNDVAAHLVNERFEEALAALPLD